jgi:hypothetical protein
LVEGLCSIFQLWRHCEKTISTFIPHMYPGVNLKWEVTNEYYGIEHEIQGQLEELRGKEFLVNILKVYELFVKLGGLRD